MDARMDALMDARVGRVLPHSTLHGRTHLPNIGDRIEARAQQDQHIPWRTHASRQWQRTCTPAPLHSLSVLTQCHVAGVANFVAAPAQVSGDARSKDIACSNASLHPQQRAVHTLASGVMVWR